MNELLSKVRLNSKGLIPVVIQDAATGKVLTLCYMNDEALVKTLEEGKVYVFRRSRGKLMMKGQTSGHTQLVKECYIDCEGNSLLLKVEQKVGACHAGYFTCYYRKAGADGALEITDKKVFDPEDKYK